MVLRRVFVLFLILVLGGGVPAGAQDIFLKYDKSKAKEKQESGEGKKPTLYVKPQSSKSSSAGGISYKDRIYNNKLQKISKIKMESLDDWHRSGYQPQTAEEIRSYANASRAASQNIMYKRRAALMAHLERKQARIARANISTQQKSALQLRHEQALASQAMTTEGKEKKKNSPSSSFVSAKGRPEQRPVYIKPENKAKSKKVFNQHR